MISFTADLHRFSRMGEKTGWTYFLIPDKLAQKLNPGNKKSFRVKGMLDKHPIKSVAILPMGNGDFIMAFNATMRKGTGKQAGDKIKASLEVDTDQYKINKELLLCLKDEPVATKYFRSLAPGHQRYFSKYVDDAKTVGTKAKRIARIIHALNNEWDYGQMLRNKTGFN